MKVYPKNDTIRKLIRHSNGMGFPEKGPAEWPDDTFTHRRIMDGDVTVEDKTVATDKPVAKDK